MVKIRHLPNKDQSLNCPAGPHEWSDSDTSEAQQDDIDVVPSLGKCCVFTRLCRVKTQGTLVEPERRDQCDSDFDLTSWHSGRYGLYVSTEGCMLGV